MNNTVRRTSLDGDPVPRYHTEVLRVFKGDAHRRHQWFRLQGSKSDASLEEEKGKWQCP